MNKSPIKLLIAEDELNLSYVLQKELMRQGCNVTIAHNGDDAIQLARQEEFHVALLDMMMPGANGIQVLRALCEQEPAPEVIILTGHATVNTALEAMKLGAYDYLTKPCSLVELAEVIRKAHEKNQLKRENMVLQSLVRKANAQVPVTAAGRYGVVAESEKMQAVVSQIDLVAQNLAPIFINGEAGSGRELIARAIHHASSRRSRPFVTLNCATMPEALVEAELFGYEAGAFTSARKRKLGLFELADHGTLFLEEVGHLSSVVQAKLNQVLETKGFYRIGSSRKMDVNFRLITASSQNLSAATQKGLFSLELFHRINSVRVTLPTLRERREDVLPMAEHFVKNLAPNRDIVITPEAQKVLLAYQWPGNVSELRNVMERAVLLSRSNVIEPADLLVELSGQERTPVYPRTNFGAEPVSVGMDYHKGTMTGVNGNAAITKEQIARLEETERREILTALERTNWHQGKTADLLGISPSTLYRRLREYKITKRMIRAQQSSMQS